VVDPVSGAISVAILGVIIAGVVIGLLGKLLVRSEDMPLWLTILCGVGGAIGGWFLYGAISGGDARESGWLRWLVAGVVATLAVINAQLTFRADSSKG
jgi:uncharacterized membrane protein YeaQ/YmgE (transglycosylase-associated protein family)